MVETDAAVGIHIGVGVLDFAHLAQDLGDGLEAETSQISDVIVLDVLVGEELQVHEPRVCFSQDSMSVAWDDSSFFQGLVDVLFDFSLAGLLSVVEFF